MALAALPEVEGEMKRLVLETGMDLVAGDGTRRPYFLWDRRSASGCSPFRLTTEQLPSAALPLLVSG